MTVTPRFALVLAVGACEPPAASIDAAVTDTAREDAPMWTTLFDGTLTPAWRMSTIVNQPGRDDPGRFDVVEDSLSGRPGTDIGLLWHTTAAPADFELELEWKASAPDDNSGVFIRFPDLDSKGYDNTAFVAANFGFEVQIDATGHPDGAPHHTTGAIYNALDQQFSLVPARPVGQWNVYRIQAIGQLYTVLLNDTQVTRFANSDPARGVATPAHVGIQTHTGSVAFRKIRIRSLR